MGPMSGMIPNIEQALTGVEHVSIPPPGGVTFVSQAEFDAKFPPVEQALTWAQQIAELQVENAALREENAKMQDRLVKLCHRLVDGYAVVHLDVKPSFDPTVTLRPGFMSATLPAVSHDTIPLNALKHSR
jgi:hypothetical protein